MVAQPSALSDIQLGTPAVQPTTSTVERITALLAQLPLAQQQQVLDFVEFLVHQNSSHQDLPQTAAQSIWEAIDDRLSAVPDAAWENVPTDGSYQHDHYLYGTPRRTP
jgi:hypothetical protein